MYIFYDFFVLICRPAQKKQGIYYISFQYIIISILLSILFMFNHDKK